MAILSFKKRFAGKVQNGSKRQTIRAVRKYPIKPGDKLYLYTALRTKHAKKLREVICNEVYNIRIALHHNYVSYENATFFCYMDTNSEQLNEFAKADGFKDWNDMRDFWLMVHGDKEHKYFEGILIKW